MQQPISCEHRKGCAGQRESNVPQKGKTYLGHFQEPVEAQGSVKDGAEEKNAHVAFHAKETEKTQHKNHPDQRVGKIVFHGVKLFIQALKQAVHHHIQIDQRSQRRQYL